MTREQLIDIWRDYVNQLAVLLVELERGENGTAAETIKQYVEEVVRCERGLLDQHNRREFTAGSSHLGAQIGEDGGAAVGRALCAEHWHLLLCSCRCCLVLDAWSDGWADSASVPVMDGAAGQCTWTQRLLIAAALTLACASQSMLSMRMHLINPSATRQFLSARLEDEGVSPGEIETAERWLNVAVCAEQAIQHSDRES